MQPTHGIPGASPDIPWAVYTLRMRACATLSSRRDLPGVVTFARARMLSCAATYIESLARCWAQDLEGNTATLEKKNYEAYLTLIESGKQFREARDAHSA